MIVGLSQTPLGRCVIGWHMRCVTCPQRSWEQKPDFQNHPGPGGSRRKGGPVFLNPGKEEDLLRVSRRRALRACSAVTVLNGFTCLHVQTAPPCTLAPSR